MVKPVRQDDLPHVPILEVDRQWEAAEQSGELGRQAASRWAGEALGISAPAHLWHVMHPRTGGDFFEGEEVVVLLLPQHQDLREELVPHAECYECELDLPDDLIARVDAIMEDRLEDLEVAGACDNRAGAWPKGKAKAKGKVKAKAKPKPKGRPPSALKRELLPVDLPELQPNTVGLAAPDWRATTRRLLVDGGGTRDESRPGLRLETVGGLCQWIEG